MSMTCRNVLQLRDVYLDGELSPSLTAELHAHLLQCPECQQQIEMLRACGDVIAKDDPNPVLPSGFASRVVASLARDASAPVSAGLPTRRDRQQRYWRLAVSSFLPAAAAVLFLSVLIWPADGPAGPHSLVRGVQKPAELVGENIQPALDVVSQVKADAAVLGEIVGLSVHEVRRDMAATKHAETPMSAFWEIFFELPSRELLAPPPATQEGPTPAADNNIVRF